MKIDLTALVDGIEFQTNESQSFLNIKSDEILFFTDEELQLAEGQKDISEYAQWMQDAINTIRKFLQEQDNYLQLPTKYDFHEYHVMEQFILSLPHESQREELYYSIKGKGAFSNFKRGLDRYSLEDVWYEFRNEALKNLAIEWCKANDIELK